MTARGAVSRTALTVARRALTAQLNSIAANVRSSRAGATRATATVAPARSSEPASSASASRRPAVPPSDTIRTSTRGIRPGILPRHANQRPTGNSRHLPAARVRAGPVVGSGAPRGLGLDHADARRALDRVPAGGRPAGHGGRGGLARARTSRADPVRVHGRPGQAGGSTGPGRHIDLRDLDL